MTVTLQARVSDMKDGTYRPEVVLDTDCPYGGPSGGQDGSFLFAPRPTAKEAREIAQAYVTWARLQHGCLGSATSSARNLCAPKAYMRPAAAARTIEDGDQ
jgi:hypothetical protein